MLEFVIAITLSAAAPLLVGAAATARLKTRKPKPQAEPDPGRATGTALDGHRRRPDLGVVCGSIIAVALGLFLAVGPAAAKPNIGVTCSFAKMVKGSKCIKKTETDIMNSHRTRISSHALPTARSIAARRAAPGRVTTAPP